MRLIIGLILIVFAQVLSAQQIQATCTEQTIESFTDAMDLGAHGIHLDVVFDQEMPKLMSGILLSDAIKAIEWHTKSYTRYEVKYIVNINKSPRYKTDAKLLYELTDSYIPMSRVTIRSEDFTTLRHWNKAYPHVKTEVVANANKSVATNLANLKYKPKIYSTDINTISEDKLKQLRSRTVKSAVEIVNDSTAMRNLTEWQADYIVTDSIRLANELNLTREVRTPKK